MFWDCNMAGPGIREIWQGFRSAVELTRDGDSESAEAIVMAMGCTPMTLNDKGNKFASYDERGNRYEMPMYVVWSF